MKWIGYIMGVVYMAALVFVVFKIGAIVWAVDPVLFISIIYLIVGYAGFRAANFAGDSKPRAGNRGVYFNGNTQ